MRSTRRMYSLPVFKVFLAFIAVISSMFVASSASQMVSPASPAAAEGGTGSQQNKIISTGQIAIEGWVTAVDGSTPVSDATVTLADGVQSLTDSTGHFAFGLEQIAGKLTTDGTTPALANLTVTADGYSAWSIQGARYYKDDTLRLYPKLEGSDKPAQVHIAASSRSISAAAKTSPSANLQQGIGSIAPNSNTSANIGLSTMPDMSLHANGAQNVVSMQSYSASSNVTPPSQIRVYRTGTGTVDTVSFREYVKHVLPNEWIPTWGAASLRAGAMAVKEYAWYWVNLGGKQASLGADVKDNTDDQVYDPDVSYASTDAAVDATWAYVLLRNNSLFQAQYCAGSYGADPSGDCPWNNEYMTQWGSAYYSDQGQPWTWIIQFYYPDATIGPGTPNGGGPLPTVPPSLPTPVPAHFAVGEGSGQPDVFLDAYNRNGGEAALGKPTGAAHWWLQYVSDVNILAQPFAGANGQGNTWLVFDTLKSQVSGISRAYLLQGKIALEYSGHTPVGPEWIGAPTSDPYTAANGQTAQGFMKGSLQSDGTNVAYTAWPTQFNGWQAEYFVGKQSQVPALNFLGQPSLVLDQPSPDINWAPGANVPQSMGLGAASWSAQFTRQMQPDAGTYDIVVTADSGVRVWIDNLLAINKWDATATHTEQYNIDFDGSQHTIRIQYQGGNGAGQMSFTQTRRQPAQAQPPTDPTTPKIAPTATPEPPTASGSAGLRIAVRWLGRLSPPNSTWQQPLTLLLSVPGDPKIVGTFAGSTDQNGVAIYSNLPAGTYDVHVKGLHSLQSARANVTLAANQTLALDMKAQIEGDVNNDNCVNVDDLSIVQTMMGANKDTPGWNSAADLNNDGQVTAEDVSLVRSGFDLCGDISADTEYHTDAAEGSPTMEQQLSPWLNPDSLSHNLSLEVQASAPSVKVGDIIVVSVIANAGSQPVDGGSFNLKYDPSSLVPVDKKGNSVTASEPGVALPAVLGNWIDPQGGSIGYASSMLQGTPPQGRFTLATIRFRALQAGSTELHFAPLSTGQVMLTNGGMNLLAQTSSLALTVTP